MKKSIWVTVVVLVVVLCIGSSDVLATITYDFGGEYDIDFVINDRVYVRNNASGEPTTVNLLLGGSVGDLHVWDTSQINIYGGTVGNYFYADDDSRVTMSSGMITGHFEAGYNSTIDITGGTIGDFQSEGYSQSAISNASIGALLVNYRSIVTIDNVSVGQSVQAQHDTQLTIYSGVIGDDLLTKDNSQVTIFGGTFGDIFDLIEESVVTIHGSGFNYGYGEITNSTGILTGTLANGDLINNRFYVHGNASIVLVPEPAALLLLGLGAVRLRSRQAVMLRKK